MKYIPWIFGLIMAAGLVASVVVASGGSVDVLNPVGEIGQRQRNLLYFAIGLSLFVVIPVFTMAIYIAHKYRKGNKKAYYAPDWDSSRQAEATWWGLPILLILILSVVTWNTTHSLDPYKPLSNYGEPIEVEVVALEWKWLFIYPQYDIASLNELNLPQDVAVNFKLTADAPMNSFWIPALGSQIYVMNGMQSKLHLVSNQTGTVVGKSANISGEGFAKMTFNSITHSQADFDSWVASAKKEGFTLGLYRYEQLAKPSVEEEPIYYSKIEPNLFNVVMSKYMGHGNH